MPTQSSNSRHWSVRTSGNDAHIILPAESTEEDYRKVVALVAEALREMKEAAGC